MILKKGYLLNIVKSFRNFASIVMTIGSDKHNWVRDTVYMTVTQNSLYGGKTSDNKFTSSVEGNWKSPVLSLVLDFLYRTLYLYDFFSETFMRKNMSHFVLFKKITNEIETLFSKWVFQRISHPISLKKIILTLCRIFVVLHCKIKSLFHPLTFQSI